MSVLVLGEDSDSTIDGVVDELNTRGVPVFRCDTSWFPDRLTIDAKIGSDQWVGTLSTSHRQTSLEGLRSIWYRRPTAFDLPANLSEPERAHALAEARFGFGGVLGSLETLWVNHPSREADASYKPRELVAAQRCGLTVPRTLITNRPDAVRDFAAELDQPLVTKPLASMYLFEQGLMKAAHTHLLTDEDLADLHGVQATAHLFQEYLSKAYECRITAVGDRLFAVAIHAGSDAARIDWRTDYAALSYEVIQPPTEIINGVHAYLGAFGLNFGAFDFVITREQPPRWVFLECNVSGQFGWLEAATGLPISSAIADLLEKGYA